MLQFVRLLRFSKRAKLHKQLELIELGTLDDTNS